MGARLSPTALHVQHDDHLSMYCNRRITGTDHRNLPLRHDRGGNDITAKTAHLAMHNHGHVNQVEELQATTSLHEHRDVHQHQHSQAQRSHGGCHWERCVRELYHHEPSARSVSNVQTSPVSSSTQVRGPKADDVDELTCWGTLAPMCRVTVALFSSGEKVRKTR